MLILIVFYFERGCKVYFCVLLSCLYVVCVIRNYFTCMASLFIFIQRQLLNTQYIPDTVISLVFVLANNP